MEPVTFSLPAPQGELLSPSDVLVTDGNRPVPCQFRVTSRWPDDSVRWLVGHGLFDLPARSPKEFQVIWLPDEKKRAVASLEAPLELAVATSLKESNLGWELSTGTLDLVLPRVGLRLFENIILRGKPPWSGGSCTGFAIVDREGDIYSTAHEKETRLSVEESGPIYTRVMLSGKHRSAERAFLDFRIWLHAWAGKPYVAVDYQFLHTEGARPAEITRVLLRWEFADDEDVILATGDGYPLTRIVSDPVRAKISADARRLLEAPEGNLNDTFGGDFWVNWTGPRGGIAVTLRHAVFEFPKRLMATPESLTIDLHPDTAEPLLLHQGTAKTHSLLLHLHPRETGPGEVAIRSLQFQIPDVPSVPPEWHAQCHVWEDVFPVPAPSPRWEASIDALLDHRPRGFGMMHFGDQPQLRTLAGDPAGTPVLWLNNAADFPHLGFLHHARTGQRRFRDAAVAAVTHWRDMDYVHFSERPLAQGGHLCPSEDHASGGVDLGHECVEGLLDHYHLTGLDESYRCALWIGQNISRHFVNAPPVSRIGQVRISVLGRALHAMAVLYRETRDARFLEQATEIVVALSRWQETWGAFLSPGTNHSMVRIPSAIAITLNALDSYHRISADTDARRLLLGGADDLLANGMDRNGFFFRSELPWERGGDAGTLPLQSLAHAFRLSGDARYVQGGLRQFRHELGRLTAWATQSTDLRIAVRGQAVIRHPGRGACPPEPLPSVILPLLHFAKAAADLDLLHGLPLFS